MGIYSCHLSLDIAIAHAYWGDNPSHEYFFWFHSQNFHFFPPPTNNLSFLPLYSNPKQDTDRRPCSLVNGQSPFRPIELRKLAESRGMRTKDSPALASRARPRPHPAPSIPAATPGIQSPPANTPKDTRGPNRQRKQQRNVQPDKSQQHAGGGCREPSPPLRRGPRPFTPNFHRPIDAPQHGRSGAWVRVGVRRM